MIVCTCNGRSFAHVKSWWVCAKCLHPYKLYLEKRMSDGVDLNLFMGGPHHHEVWSVEQLLYKNDDVPDAGVWITDYKWTPKTVTGSESGLVARVWEFDE